MAREFIDSFETQDLGLWDSIGTPTIVSTTGLDMKGNYCAFLGSGDVVCRSMSDASEYYFAFQFRPTNTHNPFFYIYNGTTHLAHVALSTAKMRVYAGGDSLAFGTKNYTTSETYFIQIYLKIANSGGRFQIRYNNITDLDYTGDTLRAGFSTMNKIKVGDEMRFDNFVIDNSVMPEETEIGLQKLNGIGNSSSWTPTSGDNYTCVDEVPYNDADIVSEDVADAIDTYNIEDSPGDLVSVKCVQVQARVKKDSDSLLNNVNLVVRSNADYHGSDESLTTTYKDIVKLWESDPADSQLWTKAGIDAMQIGQRART